MRRLLYLLVLAAFIFTTGCQTVIDREKEARLEIYCNDENYVTLTGEVVKIDNDEIVDDGITLFIKCESLKQYVATVDDICQYWVFCSSKLNIAVGDTIEYTMVSTQYVSTKYDGDDFHPTPDDWFPIVAIDKNGENILSLEEGKENLIAWVNQLQYK